MGKNWMVAILVAFSTSWVWASAGQEPSDDEARAETTFVDEVVVTATTTERLIFQLPYRVDLLDGDELRTRQSARTLPEALDEVTGVMVQKTAHGQGSPFIRGFTGFRNVFLVDGIRLNNSVFRDGPNQYWATVDPFALDRLEVVKGPISVLYGSDAIGGTVNAVTHKPLDLVAGSVFGGGFRTRHSSAEDSHVGRLDLGGELGSSFRYRVGGSHKSFGELKAAEIGRQPKTDYDEWDGDFKGVLDLGRDRLLTFGAQRSRIDDAWRTHRTIFGVPWSGTTIGDEKRRSLDQDRTLTYVRFQQNASTPLFDRIEASLSYQRQEEERLRIRSDDRSDLQGFDVGTTGLVLRLEKAIGDGLLSYGFESYRDDVDSFSLRFRADGSFQRADIQGPVADDATYDLWGAYAQHEFLLGGRTTLLLGARYTRAEADAEKVADPFTGAVISLEDSWDQVVGNARILHRVGQSGRFNVFAGISQGFRAPNLSDLTRLDTARSNEIETPSPGLSPERFLSYELGWKARQPRYSAELTLFYTDITDMIIRTPTGRVLDGNNEVIKKNAGDGSVEGFEMSGTAKLGRGFSLFANLSHVDGDVLTFPTSDPTAVREPLDRLAPTSGLLGLRWDVSWKKSWAEILVMAAARQDELSSRDASDLQRIPPGGTPGYEVLTLRGGLALTSAVEAHLAVENLTDEAYRIHGSGVNQAGRNLIFGLSVDF